MRITLLLSMIALACSAHAEVDLAEVDAIFEDWSASDSPGCVVGVIRDGEFVYRRGFGSANLDYEIPNSPESVFYLASVTKQFVAAAIALLAVDGKLDLDESIRTYLPELPAYADGVTVRHCVHHTSGLRDYLAVFDLAGFDFQNYFNNSDALEVLKRQRRLNFEPGADYSYSNSNYVCLAEIVHRITGMTLREYSEEHIFKPLGMKQTLYNDDRLEVVPHRVVSYRKSGDNHKRFLKNFDSTGGGNLLSTLDDLFAWDQNFFEPEVGGPEFLELMRTRGTLNSGYELDYAFGLVSDSFRGLRRVHHGGGMLGFRTQIMRFPDERLTVIVLGNAAELNSQRLAEDVALVFLGEQAEPVPPELPDPEPSDDANLARYEGIFANQRGSYFRIDARKGWLRVSSGGPFVALYPDGTDQFRTHPDEGARVIRFMPAGDGDASTIEVTHPNGNVESCSRQARASWDADYLEGLTGDYWSEEAQVTFSFEQDEKKLMLRRPGHDTIRLQQRFRDGFVHQGTMFLITRDDSGTATGFTANGSRIIGIEFEKMTSNTN